MFRTVWIKGPTDDTYTANVIEPVVMQPAFVLLLVNTRRHFCGRGSLVRPRC